jgi:hypothetical protein
MTRFNVLKRQADYVPSTKRDSPGPPRYFNSASAAEGVANG